MAEQVGWRKDLTRNRDRQQRSVNPLGAPECQGGKPLGTSYSGSMNHTSSGRTCQVWSAQEPHEPTYTEVGEHNFCRNPDGDPKGVWCYTTDPDKRWEYCSVPICSSSMLKVLDFSADIDHERDSNGEYTGAILEVGPLPESFTICSAFMVDAWNAFFTDSSMIELLDNKGYTWVNIKLYAAIAATDPDFGYTEFYGYIGEVYFSHKIQ